ncbi:hypothetical protein PAHAL_9G179000 [Panicum hallii]|uniref:Uncharacterized protein n=1 Tax=Panicum hallii TaxID=206008 RepID=A0A2S3IKC4_9POAL|nr:hypothetical protein PAHAL_9G179000 [Panicum hallii]
MVTISLDSPSCEVTLLILCSVVYRDVTRQAKGLYRLKHVGALRNGLAYLSRYNSGWFCHTGGRAPSTDPTIVQNPHGSTIHRATIVQNSNRARAQERRRSRRPGSSRSRRARRRRRSRRSSTAANASKIAKSSDESKQKKIQPALNSNDKLSLPCQQPVEEEAPPIPITELRSKPIHVRRRRCQLWTVQLAAARCNRRTMAMVRVGGGRALRAAAATKWQPRWSGRGEVPPLPAGLGISPSPSAGRGGWEGPWCSYESGRGGEGGRRSAELRPDDVPRGKGRWQRQYVGWPGKGTAAGAELATPWADWACSTRPLLLQYSVEKMGHAWP